MEEQTNAPIFSAKNFISRMGSLESLGKFLKMYFSKATEDLKNLEDFIKQNDFEQIQLLAHGLKGASMSMEAGRVAHYLLRLEMEAKNKNPNKFGFLFECVKKEYDAFEKHMKKHAK